MAARFDKFTQKNQEVIQGAVDLALQRRHRQIETEHLTLALLTVEDILVDVDKGRFVFSKKVGEGPQ